MAHKLIGIALLWVALAALVHVATGQAGGLLVPLGLGGFLCFAGGLQLFAEGFKRELLERLGRD